MVASGNGTYPPTVPPADDALLAAFAAALSRLVTFVDTRQSQATEDDDVRALEDVGAAFTGLSAADQQRLRELLPQSVADGLGLGQ
jgi:hypothetical protein